MGFTIVKRTDDKLVIKVGNRLYTSNDVAEGTRMVYIFEKFVVKFDDSNWVEQNIKELEMWNALDQKDKQYFAKVIDWCTDPENKNRIALRQVRVLEGYGYPTRRHEKTFQRLSKAYKLSDISVEADEYTFNCFITETNRLKIYDFGRSY